ncbi:MAG: hypothetical protein A4E68_02312 [Syntrophaceae bacterium PtaB.Bin095]|nr:MAG: hypothetical protein A4E68_02312 [Syntrophaceae bacterium PtaB.Bin095]
MRKIHILLSVVLFMAMAGCTSGGGDEASVAKYSANGTYAYSDRTLTMNWTNSDFLCNGPIAGDTNTKTEVAISATTMTWTDYRDRDVMTWTRENGTAEDPAGTWTTTDLEGNTHVLAIGVTDSASGTMSWSATIHSCAGDFSPGVSAVCGNAVCQSGENASNCPDDCGAPKTGGLGSFWGDICAVLDNRVMGGASISWKGTWVADHSFGWDTIPSGHKDQSCRHYGGTIFNNIQIRDSNGKIFHVDPWAAIPSFESKPQYYIIRFDGAKVTSCKLDYDSGGWCPGDPF